MLDIPENELDIYEGVDQIRAELRELKKDRSQYIKTADVLAQYERLIEQVDKLVAVREGDGGARYEEDDKMNILLDDTFQLLSVFFLSIGRTHSTPATYMQAATIKRLLDHLKEAGSYTENDLKPISERLEQMEAIIAADENAPAGLTRFLHRRLEACKIILAELHHDICHLSPELVPIQQKLVSIRRQMTGIASKKSYSPTELKPLQEELRKLDALRVDGNWLSPNGGIPEGQQLCQGLLSEAYELAQDLIASQGDVAGPLRPIFEQLSELKTQLERLSLLHRWTLRETDLYTFQQRLKSLESQRTGGKFHAPDGTIPSRGQSVLLYVLRRSYALLYSLLSASEPVSEALMPIHNQLTTVRRCLLDVQKGGGPWSARELYPYAMKLASIDNLRVDGKFEGVGGTVPEGQGAVHALLSECYDILYELRSEAE